MKSSRLLVVFSAALSLLILGSGLLFAGAFNFAPEEDEVFFYDDMESGENGWTHYQVAEGNPTICEDEWHQEPLDSRTGLISWSNAPYKETGAGVCYNYLQSPPIPIPSLAVSATLEFWHHYLTEECCDVGTVEVSTHGDPNQAWTDITPAPYGGVLGAPKQYVQEQLDLTTHIVPGQNLHIRFRFLSDALISTVVRGWNIDDVKVLGKLGDNPPTPGPTATATATPPPPPDPEVPSPFEFGPMTIVDPQRDVAEPSLRVDPNNNVYACGPFGASRAAEYAQKSEDGGDTFRILGTPPEGRIAPGGGGDCELALGTEPLANGEYNLAYTGLEALVNFSTARSGDAGRSFVGQNLGVLDTAVDRQWMEGVGQQEVYLGFNSVGIGYRVARSTDGGLTYSPPVTGASDVGRPGPIRIDTNASHNPQGNEIVYFVYAKSGGGVGLARSLDQGLTWERFTIIPNVDADYLFPALAIDTEGNLYAAWTEGGSYDLYYAYSLRGPNGAGEVWSNKRLVNRNPIRSTVMPWIEAGDPGKISISYYGSPSDGEIQFNFRAYWHIYVNVSDDALNPNLNQNGSVAFSQTQATTHVVHWDSICTSGLGCSLNNGDRTLLDFFQNRISPVDGSIHVVYNQSNKIPRQDFGRIAIVTYSKQIKGPSLLSNAPFTPDTRPVIRTGEADPEDDAQFPFSTFGATPPDRTNINAMDITNLQLAPTCEAGLEPGAFTIELTLRDASPGALASALTEQTDSGSPAASLIFPVRWFSGTDPYSAVAKWSPTLGWTFGFNDLEFATVNGTKLETYPGNDPLVAGLVDGNTIRMTVNPSQFNALDLPATPTGDPVIRPATVGDRIYEVTAFTFGNQNADPEIQEYLNQGDSTAPFDYILSSECAPTSVTLASLQATGAQHAVRWLGLGILGAVGLFLARRHRRDR